MSPAELNSDVKLNISSIPLASSQVSIGQRVHLTVKKKTLWLDIPPTECDDLLLLTGCHGESQYRRSIKVGFVQSWWMRWTYSELIEPVWISCYGTRYSKLWIRLRVCWAYCLEYRPQVGLKTWSPGIKREEEIAAALKKINKELQMLTQIYKKRIHGEQQERWQVQAVWVWFAVSSLLLGAQKI